jgi:hypothetical protein
LHRGRSPSARARSGKAGEGAETVPERWRGGFAIRKAGCVRKGIHLPLTGLPRRSGEPLFKGAEEMSWPEASRPGSARQERPKTGISRDLGKAFPIGERFGPVILLPTRPVRRQISVDTFLKGGYDESIVCREPYPSASGQLDHADRPARGRAAHPADGPSQVWHRFADGTGAPKSVSSDWVRPGKASRQA